MFDRKKWKREYSAAHKDEITKSRRIWRKKNAERLKEYSRKLYLDSRDYYVKWYDDAYYDGNRALALDRDNHCCQICHKTEEETLIEVHHKDGKGYSTCKAKKNNSLNNLQTLCQLHHKQEHKRMREDL